MQKVWATALACELERGDRFMRSGNIYIVDKATRIDEDADELTRLVAKNIDTDQPPIKNLPAKEAVKVQVDLYEYDAECDEHGLWYVSGHRFSAVQTIACPVCSELPINLTRRLT